MENRFGLLQHLSWKNEVSGYEIASGLSHHYFGVLAVHGQFQHGGIEHSWIGRGRAFHSVLLRDLEHSI